MKFTNPFKKGNKMTDTTENPEMNPENQEHNPPSYEDLQARIEELEGMMKDEQLRALANEQNLRRRHQEELQAAHKFAAQKFAQEMLTVKDYLEMALLDQSGNFDALKMGVSMTLNELGKAFDATHIKEIPVQSGDKLDPHHHQAMREVESDLPAGAIVGVLKKGYTMNERILRPAMVTVAKAPENKAENSETA